MSFLYILRRYYITVLHKFKFVGLIFIIFLRQSNFILFFLALFKPKNAVFSLFRSSTDGNFLYSSISLSVFGDDSMKKDLRILSFCELFLHNNYYYEHPVFQNFVEKYNILLSRAFRFSLSTLNFNLLLCKGH